MPQGMRIGGIRAIFTSIGVTVCVGLLGCNSNDKPKDTMATKSPTPYLQQPVYGTTNTTGQTGSSAQNSTQQRPVTGSALPSSSFPTSANQPSPNYAVPGNNTSPTVPSYNSGSTYNSSPGSTGFGTTGGSSSIAGANLANSAGGMPSGMGSPSSGLQQPISTGTPNRFGGTTTSLPAGTPGSLGVPSIPGAGSTYDPSYQNIIPPSQPQQPRY